MNSTNALNTMQQYMWHSQIVITLEFRRQHIKFLQDTATV